MFRLRLYDKVFHWHNHIILKKVSIILISSIFMILQLNAQDSHFIKLKGQVQSDETNAVLIYCSVGLSGSNIGTVTNEDGVFEFNVPFTQRHDTLQFSHIGYKTVRVRIADIKDPDNLAIRMTEEPMQLEEIVIRETPKSAGDIVQLAIDNIRVNYPEDPFLMKAFYRETKKENGKYRALLEAALNIYDKQYSKPSKGSKIKEKVQLVEVRKTLQFDFEYEAFMNEWNLLYQFLRTNNVRYQSGSLIVKNNVYEVEGMVLYKDQLIYSIKAEDQVMGRTYRIFIEPESYSIIKIEMNSDHSGIEHPNNHMVNDSVYYKILSINSILEFKEHEGRWYPLYFNYDGKTQNINKSTGEVMKTNRVFQELLVNEVITEEVSFPGNESIMSNDLRLENQAGTYNEEFWKNYNIIKETTLDEQIIKDLEKEGSLDQQFRSKRNRE